MINIGKITDGNNHNVINNSYNSKIYTNKNILSPLVFTKKSNTGIKRPPFNKILNDVGKNKYLPAVSQEWKNSVYNYYSGLGNVNSSNLPFYDLKINSLIKGYFSLYFDHNYLIHKYSGLRARSFKAKLKSRRKTYNKIFVSKAEVKHTSDKAIINLYVFNKEKLTLLNKITKIQELFVLKPTRPKKKPRTRQLLFFIKRLKRLKRLRVLKKLRKNIILAIGKRKNKKKIIKLIKKYIYFKASERKRLWRYKFFSPPRPKNLFKKIGEYWFRYISFFTNKTINTLRKVRGSTSGFHIGQNDINYLSIFIKRKLKLKLKLKRKKPYRRILDRYHKISLMRLRKKIKKLFLIIKRLRLRFNLNKYKFEEKFLYKLSQLISKYYGKKVEFNIVNLKSIVYNGDIFTQILTKKIKKPKSNPMRRINTLLSKINIPKVNTIKERGRLKKEIDFELIGNKYKNLNLNYIINNMANLSPVDHLSSIPGSIPRNSLTAACTDKQAQPPISSPTADELNSCLLRLEQAYRGEASLPSVSQLSIIPPSHEDFIMNVFNNRKSGIITFSNVDLIKDMLRCGNWGESSNLDLYNDKDNLNKLLHSIYKEDLNLWEKISSGIFYKQKAHYLNLRNIMFENLKYKTTGGVRVTVKGRLTKRYRADRAVHKLKWKGGLKNIDSAFKGYTTVQHLGYRDSNVTHHFLYSKRRIGAFGVKVWLAGKS